MEGPRGLPTSNAASVSLSDTEALNGASTSQAQQQDSPQTLPSRQKNADPAQADLLKTRKSDVKASNDPDKVSSPSLLPVPMEHGHL